jgi:hypothetical protein
MKITINANIDMKICFVIISSLEFSDNLETQFTEFEGKNYIITSAKSENNINFVILENTIIKVKDKYSMSEVADWLTSEKGMTYGRNNLMKVLRNYGVLSRDNVPIKIDRKYLYSEIQASDSGTYPVTFATKLGLGFIYNILIDKSIKN